ncbi:MAG: YqeG family HAD IIIA-type phosphatase [bacterium]|nr:YqeG family HAD IIIA-type phosphatase [bacterium]
MSSFFSFEEYFFIMRTILKPSEIYDAVEDIEVEELYNRGYRVIFLDVDNTILKYTEKKLTLQKINWIEKLKHIGYRVFLVSNNSKYKRRLKKIVEQTELYGLYFSMKPFVWSVKELAREEYIDFRKTVVIGDQLFTDVCLGNWLRAYTILVDPLDRKVSFFRALQKETELFLLRKLNVI